MRSGGAACSTGARAAGGASAGAERRGRAPPGAGAVWSPRPFLGGRRGPDGGCGLTAPRGEGHGPRSGDWAVTGSRTLPGRVVGVGCWQRGRGPRPFQAALCAWGDLWVSAGMDEAFRSSGSGDSAAGKLQRRLPGTAPQNGPSPNGVSQRMEQLQPPGHSCEIRDCLHAGNSTGTGQGAQPGTRPQQEQPWARWHGRMSPGEEHGPSVAPREAGTGG
ncbi:uncharacterized protein [Agelaius tricolor]|uniref:uncharacterized protein n=1 Tax=Agelaius tricolor TaxID=9191 RepID=UPI0039F1C26A